MSPHATPGEIRAAYRALARIHHPDAQRGAPSSEMAGINESWFVLSDPARRALYDADRRAALRAQHDDVDDPAPPTEPWVSPIGPNEGPARYPWKFVTAFAVVGVALVLTAGVFVRAPKEPRPDNVLQPGSCVEIAANGDAVEVACSAAHAGVVHQLVPSDATCPRGTDEHRDRQGMGIACITASSVRVAEGAAPGDGG